MSPSWPHFSHEELTCHCGCGRRDMSPDFMESLVKLRRELAVPMPLSSAFRCPDHPLEINKEKQGSHAAGVAVDVQLYGADAWRLVALAAMAGFTGIGVAQNGPLNTRFIHLDRLPRGLPGHPRPTIWSY